MRRLRGIHTAPPKFSVSYISPNGDCSTLSLLVISDTQIDLTWINGSTDESGISIERSLDNITYVEIDTVYAGISVYSDTTCVASTLYYYKVRAFRGINYSEYSNVDSDTTTGLTYCAEAIALFARMDEQPTAALKTLINKTIVDMKAAGIWNISEVIYFMNVHTAQAASRNWKSDNFNITAVNSPTFTPKSGFSGAVGKYLKTGWIHNNSLMCLLTSSSTHFEMFAIPTTTAKVIFGASGGVGYYNYLMTYTTGNDRYYFMANNYMGLQNIQNNGFYSYNSPTLNIKDSFKDGANKQSSVYNSAFRVGYEMALCGLNADGTFTGIATGMKIWMTGAGFTDQQIVDLYNIKKYFTDNVGGTF